MYHDLSESEVAIGILRIMRTYLSWAMALLCMPLLAQQSTDNYSNLPQQPTTEQALLTTSSQQRCDSVVYYNENGKCYLRWEFTYDNQGHQMSLTHFITNEKDEFVIFRKCDYEYDSNGHVTCETHSHLNDYHDYYYKYHLYRMIIDDEVDIEDEELRFEERYDYPEASEGEFRIVYTYDSRGIMTNKIVKVMSVDEEGAPHWVDSGLKYEFDSHGWVLQKSSYNIYGDLWRYEYTYDENGKKTSDIYYTDAWLGDGCGGTLDYPTWIHLISYDASGKRINSTYYDGRMWPPSLWIDWEEDWYVWLAHKYEYTYDDHDNLINMVLYQGRTDFDFSEYTDGYPWGWWNSCIVDEWSIEDLSDKSSYQYDDYGRIVAQTYYSYENRGRPETEYISRVVDYQYDESGKKIMETCHNYEDESFSYKYEYIYDEFDNLVRQNYYDMRNDQWYLKSYRIYYYSNSSEFIEDITKDPLLTTPRKVFKDGKLQIEINGQCFGMDGIRF